MFVVSQLPDGHEHGALRRRDERRAASDREPVVATYRYGAGAASPPAGRLTRSSSRSRTSPRSTTRSPCGAAPTRSSPSDVRRECAGERAHLRPRDLRRRLRDRRRARARRRAGARLLDVGRAASARAREGVRRRRRRRRDIGAQPRSRAPRIRTARSPSCRRHRSELTCRCTLDGRRPTASQETSRGRRERRRPIRSCSQPASMAIGQPLYTSEVEAALARRRRRGGARAQRDRGRQRDLLERAGRLGRPRRGLVLRPVREHGHTGGGQWLTSTTATAYYANRLWHLLPGVYRAKDSDDPTSPGPLRELVDRIAGQVAVVRRSIDRLWADQSIETSDDWVDPLHRRPARHEPRERARRARTAARRRQDDPLPPAQGHGRRARGDRARRHRLGRARRRGVPPAQPHAPQARPAGRPRPVRRRAADAVPEARLLPRSTRRRTSCSGTRR